MLLGKSRLDRHILRDHHLLGSKDVPTIGCERGQFVACRWSHLDRQLRVWNHLIKVANARHRDRTLLLIEDERHAAGERHKGRLHLCGFRDEELLRSQYVLTISRQGCELVAIGKLRDDRQLRAVRHLR